MSMLFADGFELYTNANQLDERWEDEALGSAAMAAGRVRGSAMQILADNNHVAKLIASTQTLIVGFGIKVLETGAKVMPLVSFWDGATGQVLIYLGENNEIIAARLTGIDIFGRYTYMVLGASDNGVLLMTSWQYFEAKVTIANSPDGAVAVKVNGEVVLSLTGQDTQATANARATYVRLDARPMAPAQRNNRQLDDFYICNDQGARCNDFLGDCCIETLFPSAPGNYTQWTTLVGAATHREAVDETGANDADTTYVATETSGHIDTFAFTDMVADTGVMRAVQIVMVARKDESGTRKIASAARLGTTDAFGADISLGDTYHHYCQVHETDPDGATWTIAHVNAMEAGVKCTA